MLRSVLKLAKRRGLWSGDFDAVLPVGFAPEYEPVERWLSRGEVEKLMVSLTQDHAARVAFMVGAGAEWNATERARREDIAQDLSAIRIRGTKRKTRDRVVHLVMQWQRELVGFARDYGEGRTARSSATGRIACATSRPAASAPASSCARRMIFGAPA